MGSDSDERRVSTQPFVFLRGSEPGCKLCRLSAERKSLQHARPRTQRTHPPSHNVTVLVISQRALCSRSCYSRGGGGGGAPPTKATAEPKLLAALRVSWFSPFISCFVLQPFSKKAVDHVQSHLAKKQVPPTLFQVTALLPLARASAPQCFSHSLHGLHLH